MKFTSSFCFHRRPARRALLAAGLILGGLFTNAARAADSYWFIDLGTLKGYEESYANDINNSGMIVGYLKDNIDPYSARTHAFRTRGAGITDLGSLGGKYSEALSINSAGSIVGYSSNQDGKIQAFRNDGDKLAGNGALGDAINDANVIIGESTAANGQSHAFKSTRGPNFDLGTLGGTMSDATAVNNAGIVVGNSLTFTNSERAFSTLSGPMTEIGTLPGHDGSTATSINNLNVIVGDSFNTATGQQRAFRYENGQFTDLGTLALFSGANDLNDQGVIVGYNATAKGTSDSSRAFVYKDGVMSDLNTLMAASTPLNGFVLQEANAINSRGDIVGNGVAANGAKRAFLLMKAHPRAEFIGLSPSWFGVFDSSMWPYIDHTVLNFVLIKDQKSKKGIDMLPYKSKASWLRTSRKDFNKYYHLKKTKYLPEGWLKIENRHGKRWFYVIETKKWVKDF